MKRFCVESILILVLSVTFVNAYAQWSIESVTNLSSSALQYDKIEFAIAVSGSFTNPFDAQDIRLDMILQSPSGKTIALPCFYESGNATLSQWKARFTSREAGLYTYFFELRKNNVLEAVSISGQFTASVTAKDGFLLKHDHWSFRFDGGRFFRGIGENIGWEGRSWENDQYTYEYFLTTLKKSGGNYFRTWMCPWNLPLEWKTTVDTERYSSSTAYFHPQGIERMDKLVALCDSLGLYMMLTLDWHGGLMTGDRWNINPYNVSNGGPAVSPTEFFTSEAAKAQYKNRLRYIVSRWGYSPSIGAWELFNEIDNAAYNGTESTVAIPHNSITQWHTEMSAYLKSIDPYDHLITTSISHREITGLFNVTDIDFNQRHLYRVTGTIPAVIEDQRVKFSKPLVVGEFGYDWDWNNINESIGANLDYDFKRGLWYGLFSPTPVLPMSWWWEFFDERGTSNYFESVREISEQMMFAAQGSFTEVSTTSPVISLEAYALKCGNKYFVYLLNNSTSPSNNRTISLSISGSGNFNVKSFDPETREYEIREDVTASDNNISLGGLSFTGRASRIFILSPEGELTGIQAPFSGAPVQLPGRVEAEDFDKGGESLSFHDLDDINEGAQYRLDEGVDIGNRSEGGYNVTGIVNGEWLEYTVEIQKAGVYKVVASVASVQAAGNFTLTMDGERIAGSFEVPDTGGEQVWETISGSTKVLTTGIKKLRIDFDGRDFQLDALEFELINQAPSVVLKYPEEGEVFEEPVKFNLIVEAADEDGTIIKVEFFSNNIKLGEVQEAPYTFSWSPSSGSYTIHASATDNDGLVIRSGEVSVLVQPDPRQSPYPHGVPHQVPGKIEAENFDHGSHGVAYHDLTEGNIKTQYRIDTGVDIETCHDEGGGYNLADIQPSEWTEYTIDIVEAVKYDLYFRVATNMADQSFSVLLDEQPIVEKVDVPNTGDWQAWQTIKVPAVELPQGIHVLKLLFGSEFFNLNHFTIDKSPVVTSVYDPENLPSSLYPNPASDHFRLMLSPTVKKVRIMDMQGKEVYITTPRQRSDVTVVENKFPSGLYTIIIEHTAGNMEYIKAIIK